jgi:hypothetical protein
MASSGRFSYQFSAGPMPSVINPGDTMVSARQVWPGVPRLARAALSKRDACSFNSSSPASGAEAALPPNRAANVKHVRPSHTLRCDHWWHARFNWSNARTRLVSLCSPWMWWSPSNDTVLQRALHHSFHPINRSGAVQRRKRPSMSHAAHRTYRARKRHRPRNRLPGPRRRRLHHSRSRSETPTAWKCSQLAMWLLPHVALKHQSQCKSSKSRNAKAACGQCCSSTVLAWSRSSTAWRGRNGKASMSSIWRNTQGAQSWAGYRTLLREAPPHACMHWNEACTLEYGSSPSVQHGPEAP